MHKQQHSSEMHSCSAEKIVHWWNINAQQHSWLIAFKLFVNFLKGSTSMHTNNLISRLLKLVPTALFVQFNMDYDSDFEHWVHIPHSISIWWLDLSRTEYIHHSVTTFNSEEPLVSSHLVQVLNAAVEFVWFIDFKREALHVWIWWWSLLVQIGLLNVNGYYDPLLALFDKAVEEGFLSVAARLILVSAPTARELVHKMEVRQPPSQVAAAICGWHFFFRSYSCLLQPRLWHRYMCLGTWSWSTIFLFVCRDLHQYRIRTCQSCLGRLLKLPIVLGSNPEALAVVMIRPSDNSWNMCLAWVSKNNNCTPCKVWVLAMYSIRG